MSKIELPVSKLKNEINRCERLGRHKSCLSNVPLPGFENISWHFSNIPVSGEVEIVFANRWNNKTVYIDVPARTGFLTTCIQTNNGTLKMAFGASLS